MLSIIQTEREAAEAYELLMIICCDLRSALMIKRLDASHLKAAAISRLWERCIKFPVGGFNASW